MNHHLRRYGPAGLALGCIATLAIAVGAQSVPSSDPDAPTLAQHQELERRVTALEQRVTALEEDGPTPTPTPDADPDAHADPDADADADPDADPDPDPDAHAHADAHPDPCGRLP